MSEPSPEDRALIAAASRVLARTGLDSLSLEAVASEAGVAEATVRERFASTQHLLRQLVSTSMSDVADAAIAAVGEAADGPEALTRFIASWAGYYLDRIDEFRQVMMVRQLVGGDRFGVGSDEMTLVGVHVGRVLDAVEAKLRQDGTRELPGGIDPRRLAFGALVTSVGLVTIKGLSLASATPLRHANDAVLRDTSRALGATMSSMRQLAALNDAATELARTRSEAELREMVPPALRRVLGAIEAVLALRGSDRALDMVVGAESMRALESGQTVCSADGTLAATPVRYESRVEGVLAVGGRALDASDVSRLETFAAMVGLALENVRLYGDLQAQLDARTANLREALVRLGESEKMAALGKLVAGVVHEVNSPAASVLSGESTLVKAVGKLRDVVKSEDPAAERLFAIVEQSSVNVGAGVRRLSEIVDRLKRFSRLDAAELERVDVGAAIRDTIGVVESELGRQGRIQLTLETLPAVLCYASRLNQVFLDVIRNAAQAIDESGRVRVVARHDAPDAISVIVEDDGAGIGPEDLERIFEPGFNAKGGRVRAGYGLATAYLVVRDHGGDIRVQSTKGTGTRVTIRVPLSPPQSGSVERG